MFDFCFTAMNSRRGLTLAAPQLKCMHDDAGVSIQCLAVCRSGYILRGLFECRFPESAIAASLDVGCLAALVMTTTSPLNIGGTESFGSTSLETSRTVVVAVGVSAGFVFLVLLVLFVFWRRRQRSAFLGQTNQPQQQLNTLRVAKVEQLFALAFADQISEQQLFEAHAHFATLEVPRKAVKVGRQLGQGQFGDVFFGTCFKVTGPLAIKMVPVDRSRSSTSLEAEEEGLQLEARLMFQLQHPNIVRVLAVVTRSWPSWVCLEFMINGDLKTYLRSGVFV